VGGTLKRLLLHTTPRLKEPGKAHRKSPSAITEPKAFPAPFCIQVCARKASPPSGGAFSRCSSRFKLNHRSHSLTCCSLADGIIDNFFECRIKVGNLKSGSIISGRIIVGMGKIRNALYPEGIFFGMKFPWGTSFSENLELGVLNIACR